MFCFFNFIGWYDLPVLAYEISSISKFKMSGSSWLARLVQGQSDESPLLTGCLLTNPGRCPARKHHQDRQAVFSLQDGVWVGASFELHCQVW